MATYTETGLAVAVTATTSAPPDVNPLTTIRNALWAVVDADAELTGLLRGGYKFKLSNNMFPPSPVTQAYTPGLFIAPGRVPAEWATEVKQEITYLLDCVVWSTGISPQRAEDIYWAMFKAVYASWPDLSAAQSYLRGVRVGSPSVNVEKGASGPFQVWRLSFPVLVTMRWTVL